MSLSHISTDDLIAEMQVRLARGEVGYHGLYAPWQLEYRAMWTGLLETVRDLGNEDFAHPYVRRIRERMHALVDHGHPDAGVIACNTTFVGADHMTTGRAT